ncbi:hypothetical protein FDK21_19810 [Cohaesibacter sp. CAU 1516]|uniref:hypothetical protein n=1 Tax=Cohaesibacter sp. CAU 1516 TaxID=2576038 RepID=UPI0010FDE6C8|nr:hypothetical protein [Cohaesibacter sp. CAU 1516]TLP42396.1 hypothetical protein FDK21_19810 [Cohaesibacter sp. CAU 1516]
MPRYARLFAAPALKRGVDGEVTAADWYGSEPGQPTPWGALGQTDKVRVANFLRGFVKDLMTAVGRSQDPRARLVLCWLPVLSLDQDLLVVNGHPILTNWGLVPHGTMDFADKLAYHLMHGMGQFLPEGVDVADVADMITQEDRAGKTSEPELQDEPEGPQDALGEQSQTPLAEATSQAATFQPASARPANSSESAPPDARPISATRPQSPLSHPAAQRATAEGLQHTAENTMPPPTGQERITGAERDRRAPRCWLPVLIACLVAASVAAAARYFGLSQARHCRGDARQSGA